MPSTDRTRLVVGATAAVLAVIVGYEHPGLIPALTLGVAVFVVLMALLKL